MLKRRKTGSVTLVMVGVLVVLLIMFTSFLRVTTNRKSSSKKVGSIMRARELSASLAALASHYIKNVILLSNDNDKNRCTLKSDLALPLNKMQSEKTYNLAYIKNEFNKIRDSAQNGLWQQIIQNCGLNIKEPDNDIKISCIVDKKDFTPLGGAYKCYPRTKNGLLRLRIEISYIFSGTQKPVAESYEYVSNITIAANIVPVLSRFTLFVADALNDGDSDRFNTLDLDITGTIKNGEDNRPWVLKNGSPSDCGKKLYRDLIEKSNAGLVYLGSPSNKLIELGLSRGWVNIGKSKFGEDFLFYKNEDEAAGYWKTVKRLGKTESGNESGIMTANIGFCADEGGDNADWLAQMGSKNRDLAKRASALKLYGTDEAPSPTLVLGCVASTFMSVNMYKCGSNIDFLKRFDNADDFMREAGLANENNGEGAEYGALVNFGFDVYIAHNITPNYKDYLDHFASAIGRTPYNMGYLYAFRPNTPFPIGNGVNKSDNMAIYSLWNPDSPDANLLNSVPKPYSDIYGEQVKLNEFDKFINPQALNAGGGTFKPNKLIDLSKLSSADIQRMFANNRLFKEYFLMCKKAGHYSLDLNGWLYIKANSAVELGELKVISHGGIIVDGANIELKGNIIAENSAHLTIIALNGNINVDSAVSRLDASLYALGKPRGQVKFEKNANNLVVVNGNIVMRSFFGSSTSDDALKREVRLNYKGELAAMPVVNGFAPSDEGLSEKAVLMYDYSNDPRLIE